MKNNIICITPIDHIKGLKDLIKTKGNLIYKPHISKTILKKVLFENKKINSIFCNPNKQGFVIDKDILKLSGIKLINTASTGTNHINLKDCNELGIQVMSLKNDKKLIYNLPSTSELAFCLMISLLKKLVPSHNSVKNKNNWNYEQFIGQELSSLTIGIIGFGRLGKFMAKFCHAFGMNILIYDKYKPSKKYRNVSKSYLVKHSDVISVHVHLDNNTKNLININLLKKCFRSPIVINTSRGEVVNELDIVNSLKNNLISGYGTDVITNELDSIKKSHIIKNISKLNIIVTPHVGGMTFQGQKRAFEWAINKFS